MNKDIINIGIVSKGRLKEESEKIFRKNNFKIYTEDGERGLVAKVKGRKNIRVLFLHAREIIDQLSLGNIDLGISGFDLLMESEINIQKNIKVEKKLKFGFATLQLAVRKEFIDVFTTLDLDEVAEDYRRKNKKLIRIGTKYPNLTRDALYKRGVTNFTIVKSLGSTELMPAMDTAMLVSDISSTGTTMKKNHLRPLSDGEILKSQACLLSSKKGTNKKGLKSLIGLFSK